MDNNNLLTGKKYIKDIFNQEQFYNIPEYQRPYVWGVDQIENFLDDITNALESNKEKEYFVGCMIWNTRETESNGIKYKFQDILDGQQRFLTLFLLHAVLRNLSSSEKLKTNVQNRLIQEADEFNNVPARNRIEFDIRDDKNFIDRYIINEIELNSEILEQLAKNYDNSSSVRNLANGMSIILNWFNAKEREDAENFQEFLVKFYTYLSNKVLALYLATPNNLDDAYNLFTVLNSRGLQLQVSDILRAQNLRVILDDKIRREYANKWSDFENKINLPYKSFDEFLWAVVFIKMKYRSDDNQTLTKAFDFMFKKGLMVKGSETLDIVEKYINHFLAVNNGSIATKDSAYLFSNINFILSSVYGSQYLTPLMHFKESFDEHNIVEFIVKIDNLFSLGWLLGRRQSMTRTFTIIKRIEYYNDKVVKKELSKEEASRLMINDECLKYDYFDENISSEKPLNIDDLENSLRNDRWGGFSGTKVNKTRYLLLKLDLLMGSKNNQIQYNKNSSSIEHLMPQKIENTLWSIDLDFHKEWLHKIGNLVLIDRNKNSSLSNKNYEIKKTKYKGAIEARANTNYVLMQNNEWNQDAIIENQDRIVKLIMKYYQGNSLDTFLEIQRN
ncbi:DUF262 domain-containing HNH endonuclease family protein [Chryseobacterium formosus]|uniref:DUF262 domain-containing HNH endonuclease family protein n=1 Tax=Chryseobacterium formosus TaxID=1537363 RepID=A0ABT3XTQ0_9FLAO|nr:DUF262 domain-containing HNH endonuclease family protein [Chryseobacterium formosus]MCX8524670.1 DUF262 domain-containing HNH endonuclease family protein [Chryseobacterium formosus]